MIERVTNLFKKPEQEILEPSFRQPRFPCPFYGFYVCGHLLFIDQKGNQCPLMERACQMQDPDWEKCPFNCVENENVINEIINDTCITPNEFWPKGQRKWKGIPFKSWMSYVMDSNTPRP
ncbi:MAG TPA: hypothetical protein PKU93_01665 [Candidatus Pacearchaeota archaeon]|mgnify:FL=1|nr:hypothetical protein [Candidatus Pacearchaeota archaeon]